MIRLDLVCGVPPDIVRNGQPAAGVDGGPFGRGGDDEGAVDEDGGAGADELGDLGSC